MQSSSISSFNNPLIRFISEKKFSWLRHTLFIVMGLVLAFKDDIGGGVHFPSPQAQRATLLVDTLLFVIIISLIYLMLLVFVPKLLFRSKWLLFTISFIATASFIFFIAWWLDDRIMRPVNPKNMPHIELSFIAYIQIVTVSSVLIAAVVGLKVFKKWINDIKRMNELQQESMKAELEQLKSQVNPHFLFNTLNNLFVLTKTDPDKASQVLLGLSDLLRYQLYDSSKEKIVLSKDIAFIENLLSLEKIRKNDFEYTIHTEGNIDGQLLPPFLFIPFVENAIKHGASTVGHSYLTLHFRVSEKELYFYSENSKPTVKKATIGGLGLVNIKRRLELLYPSCHTLNITDDPDKYIVNLIIPL